VQKTVSNIISQITGNQHHLTDLHYIHSGSRRRYWKHPYIGYRPKVDVFNLDRHPEFPASNRVSEWKFFWNKSSQIPFQRPH